MPTTASNGKNFLVPREDGGARCGFLAVLVGKTVAGGNAMAWTLDKSKTSLSSLLHKASMCTSRPKPTKGEIKPLIRASVNADFAVSGKALASAIGIPDVKMSTL